MSTPTIASLKTQLLLGRLGLELFLRNHLDHLYLLMSSMGMTSDEIWQWPSGQHSHRLPCDLRSNGAEIYRFYYVKIACKE